MSEISYIILFIFIIVLFNLLLFLLFREVFCWYWKINRRLEEMRKTTLYLEAIYRLLAQGNSINAVTAEVLLNGGEGGGTAGGYNDSDIPDL